MIISEARNESAPSGVAAPMNLEVVLPDESPAMPAATLVELARSAERLGYRTAYLPDHILPPDEYGPTYGGVYEPLVTIGHLTAVTERIRFGTSVLVLPLRNPFVLAKQVATLQQLSAGRVVLGVGIGWSEEEFAAVGAEHRRRGAVTDDALDLFRQLTTEGRGPYQNRRFGYDTGVFAPHPDVAVPVLVGGNSDAALRRSARYADLWQGLPAAPEVFAERVQTLAGLATDRTVSPGVRIQWDGGRPVTEAVAEISAYREAGAQHLAVHFGGYPGYADRMAALAAAVPAGVLS